MKTDPQRRARDIKFIHAAARELGMDRAAYEDMLFALTRCRSCGDLDFTGLQRVREHLIRCGAGGKPAARGQGRGAGEWAFVERRPAHEQKQWRYLIVLCRDYGIARGRQTAYVEGIHKRIHGLPREVEAPPALWSGADLANAISALKRDIESRARRGRHA